MTFQQTILKFLSTTDKYDSIVEIQEITQQIENRNTERATLKSLKTDLKAVETNKQTTQRT